MRKGVVVKVSAADRVCLEAVVAKPESKGYAAAREFYEWVVESKIDLATRSLLGLCDRCCLLFFILGRADLQWHGEPGRDDPPATSGATTAAAGWRRRGRPGPVPSASRPGAVRSIPRQDLSVMITGQRCPRRRL